MIEERTTLADVLHFDQQFAEPLRERLRLLAERWALPTQALRSSAVGQVVERIGEAFRTPLYMVLAAAWRRHPGCRAFCDPAEHPPGEVNTMEMLEHTLGWECEPAIEVVADGLDAVGLDRLAELSFEIEVETVVKGGLLTIQDARFIKLEAAELELAALLRLEGFTIARYAVPLRMPGALRFGDDGVPICPEPAARPAREPAEAAAPAPAQVPGPAIAPEPVVA